MKNLLLTIFAIFPSALLHAQDYTFYCNIDSMFEANIKMIENDEKIIEGKINVDTWRHNYYDWGSYNGLHFVNFCQIVGGVENCNVLVSQSLFHQPVSSIILRQWFKNSNLKGKNSFEGTPYSQIFTPYNYLPKNLYYSDARFESSTIASLRESCRYLFPTDTLLELFDVDNYFKVNLSKTKKERDGYLFRNSAFNQFLASLGVLDMEINYGIYILPVSEKQINKIRQWYNDNHSKFTSYRFERLQYLKNHRSNDAIEIMQDDRELERIKKEIGLPIK